MTLLAWWFAACDDSPAPRVILCANSIQQANESLWSTILWQHGNNPKLSSRFKNKKGSYRLVNEARNGYLGLVSAEGRTSHGGSPTLIVFDELSWSRNNDLYVGLSSGMGARDNALSVTCSTVSHITDNIFHDQLEHARKVRDGIESDPRFLPCIYELPLDADWRDKKLWGLSNPNLHLGLPNDLESEYQKALSLPSYEAEFRLTKLNQIVGAKNLWLPIHEYDSCPHDSWSDEADKLPGVIGVDLSTSQDVTSFVATYYHNDCLYVEPFFFLPEDNIHERVRVHKVRWDKWADDPKNNLILTPGNVIEYARVSDEIIKYCETHNIECVYFDRHKWTSVIQAVANTGVECLGVNQDFASMNAPCHEFERLVLNHKLIVKNNNPIYRWMVSHAHVRTNSGGEIRVEKPKHKDHRKVDGISATLNTILHHTRLREQVVNFDVPFPR